MLAAGLSLGTLLGYTWASREREPVQEPVAAPAPSPPPTVDPPRPQPPSDDRYLERPALPSVTRRRPHGGPELTASQVAELRAKVADLIDQLAAARQKLATESRPLSPPPNLPERFSEKAIVAALTSAVREVGAHIQLSSIDCTEYPCIAYLQTFTEKDMEVLKKSTAYKTYADDRFLAIGRAGPDGPYDGLVVWPANDPTPRNDFRARLRFRMGEMLP
jgi:hypothetical protein